MSQMYATVFARSLFRIQRQQILVARHARLLTTQPSKPPNDPGSSASPHRPSSSSKNEHPPSNYQKESPSSPQPETPPSPTSISLDFMPEQNEPQRTGAKSSKDSLSSIERKRRNASRFSLAMLGLGAVAAAVYMGRDWEDGELKHMKISVENAPSTRIGRTKARFMNLFNFFSEPTWDELLPPAVPAYQKPYTLLLSIDDLLVTSTWDRVNGWRTAKRPGVDYFLAYLSQFYEIVIFTSQHHYTALPILEKLDPYNFFITYKLFRESTKSVGGSIKKDLTYLNRDLSKVILIDTDPEHVSLQPENSMILPKWKGDAHDKGLVALIPFLESIAIYKPQDVRPILTAYHGKDIAIEYGKKEAEAKAKFLEEWRQSGKGKTGVGMTFSGLFGGSSQSKQPREPLTYLEQKRREAQMHYLDEQKYIAENREQFDKLIEEDKQAQAAQMSGSMWNVLQVMTGGAPPPPPPPPAGAPIEGKTAEEKSKGSEGKKGDVMVKVS